MIVYDIPVYMGRENKDTGPLLKRHDSGVRLSVKLFRFTQVSKWREASEPYRIPEGATAVIRVKKPDKTASVTDAEPKHGTNIVLCALPPEALAAPGTCNAEIVLYSAEGKRLTSSTFIFEAADECVCDDDPKSEDYVDIFSKDKTIQKLGEQVKDLDEQVKKLAEDGGGGVDVSGATVGHIIKVAAVDEKGKPTAWAPANLPTKLSDLENDLYYSKAEPFIALTAADFVPKYFTDEDGNPTDEVDCYYYKGTPAPDWFTAPDKVGFMVANTEDGEQVTYKHNLPSAEANYDDDEWCESDYWDGENRLYPWHYCDECGIDISSGVNVFSQDELTPENAFYVRTWWYNDSGAGFDSITIYKVDTKKIPASLLEVDLSQVNSAFEYFDGQINGLWNELNGVSALADEINGEVV